MTPLDNRSMFEPGVFPAWPLWDEHEEDSLTAVLREGLWGSSRGYRARDFAGRFARYQGATIGLAMANGTCTLEAALVACDVGPGDEVIVPALTFVATATAVLRVNAVPVIVDVEPDSLCLSADEVAAAITPRTKAVIAVHLAGGMCDMERLLSLCDANGLSVVEDCAHAHGSRLMGRGAGSWGVFGSFSFQHSKLITAGEGGVLVTSDPDRAEVAASFANCGRRPGGATYDHVRLGVNYRMTEWQGAVLAAQLDRYPDQLARREANARILTEQLAPVPGLRPQARDTRMDAHAYYGFVLHYDPCAFGGLPARRFGEALAAEGVPVSHSYPSLTNLAMFRSGALAPTPDTSGGRFRAGVCSVAENAERSTVWLHHRTLLADGEQVARVADICRRIQRGAGRLGG